MHFNLQIKMPKPNLISEMGLLNTLQTVFACTKDHWICARCLPRNESCPFCREDFKARPPTRRVTYEKFLAVVTEHLAIVEEKLNCDEINKSN